MTSVAAAATHSAAVVRSAWTGTKPLASSTAGIARIEPSTSDEKSPSTARSANAGTGTTAGRCIARASAATTSALRAGAVTRLTGPCTGAVSRCSTARTWSSSVIHGQNCRPDPSRPPTPSRISGSSRPRAPPPWPSTMPVRRWTTRTPGVLRGCGRRFPVPHDVREERGAERLVLVQHVLAARAVRADPRRLQQHLRPVVQRGERPGEQAGGVQAGRQDLALAGRRERSGAGVDAREVDDGVGAGHGVGVEAPCVRVPGDLRRAAARDRGPGRGPS